MTRLGLLVTQEGTNTIRRRVARAFFDSMADDQGYDAALRTVSALTHHSSSATTEHYLREPSSERKRRDERLGVQPFLAAVIQTAEVLPLRPDIDGRDREVRA